MNTVIVAYRNRKKSLFTFLASIEIAYQYAKEGVEIIITDLGSTDNSNSVFRRYTRKINLKHNFIDYKGPFWKTKALNSAFLMSSGDLITMLDIDAVVLPNFFSHIEDFFKTMKGHKTKLAHRVRFLEYGYSRELFRNVNSFSKSYLENFLVKKAKRARIARERFDEDEKLLSRLHKKRQKVTVIKNALGNSHYTIHKEAYDAIGGYDERFVGHGLEDLDFNLRLFRYCRNGYLYTRPRYNVYNVTHKYEKDWLDDNLRDKNRKVYRHNKNNNVVAIKKRDNWGVFD